MNDTRFFLPDRPEFKDVYSRDELRQLLKDGRLSRSDFVLDDQTGLAHLLGDLLAAPHPDVVPKAKRLTPRSQEIPSVPTVQEFRADTPLPVRDELEYEDEDDDQTDGLEEIEEDESVGLESPREPHEPESAYEELLYHGRPSFLCYPKSILLFLIFTAAAVWCVKQQLRIELTITAGSLAGLVLVFVALNRIGVDYLVTTERVEIESGIVGRSSKEIRIRDIRAIDVYQSGWNVLAGSGTVEFSSSAGEGDQVRFKNVWRPHRIKELVRAVQS